MKLYGLKTQNDYFCYYGEKIALFTKSAAQARLDSDPNCISMFNIEDEFPSLINDESCSPNRAKFCGSALDLVRG